MGMKVGDEMDKVNEKSVRYSTHAQIVTTIHEVTEFFNPLLYVCGVPMFCSI